MQLNNAALTIDHACAHCGYNLRGLSPEGTCPECATPVAHSLRGDLLKNADPEWLERLRFGTALLLWQIGLSIVVGIASAFLVGIGLPPVLRPVFRFIGGAVGLWGSFVITTQEPRIALTEDPVTWRKVIRVCAAAAWLGPMVEEIRWTGTLGGVVGGVAAVLLLVGVVALFGELKYLRRFALRIPDPRLARSTKTVMWGLSISLTVMNVGEIVQKLFSGGMATLTAGAGGATTVTAGSLAQTGAAAGGIVMCGKAIPLIGFLVWYVILLRRYKGVFTMAAEEARGLVSSNAAPRDAPPIASD